MKKERVYNIELDPEIDDCIYTIEEWENEVKNIICSTYDGYGYYMKDSLMSKDEVFSTSKEDATHVVWYNK